MKINIDIFLAATAKAMQNDSTKKLFKAEPVTFNMFSLFAFAVFNRLDGKDITEDDFDDTAADVIAEILPEDITDGTMLKAMSLVTFSNMIWTELEKTGQARSERI